MAASSKTLSFNIDYSKNPVETWRLFLYIASKMMSLKMFDVSVGFSFTMASYFVYIGFCCAGHIYDNSTLMEADLILMPVFFGRLRFWGIVSTLVTARP